MEKAIKFIDRKRKELKEVKRDIISVLTNMKTVDTDTSFAVLREEYGWTEEDVEAYRYESNILAYDGDGYPFKVFPTKIMGTSVECVDIEAGGSITLDITWLDAYTLLGIMNIASEMTPSNWDYADTGEDCAELSGRMPLSMVYDLGEEKYFHEGREVVPRYYVSKY